MVMQCEEPQHLDSCCSRLLQHNSINSIIYKAKVGFILWLDLVFGASRFSFTCSSTNYFREYPAAKCQDSPSGPWGHCWSAYSGMRACIASLACSKPPCTESHTHTLTGSRGLERKIQFNCFMAAKWVEQYVV